MAKYIKLDDAIELLKSHMLDEDDENVTVECPNECNEMLDSAVEYIGAMPTIEIVRCNECKRQDTDNAFHSMWCYENRNFVKPNDFCSRGKRKDNG